MTATAHTRDVALAWHATLRFRERGRHVIDQTNGVDGGGQLP